MKYAITHSMFSVFMLVVLFLACFSGYSQTEITIEMDSISTALEDRTDSLYGVLLDDPVFSRTNFRDKTIESQVGYLIQLKPLMGENFVAEKLKLLSQCRKAESDEYGYFAEKYPEAAQSFNYLKRQYLSSYHSIVIKVSQLKGEEEDLAVKSTGKHTLVLDMDISE